MFNKVQIKTCGQSELEEDLAGQAMFFNEFFKMGM